MSEPMVERREPAGEDVSAPVYGLERYRHRPRGEERTAHVGMAIFLGSWAMLFIGLFFAYALVRTRAPLWPPLDAPPLPRLIPGLNTLAILASSAAMVRAVRSVELGRNRQGFQGLAAAAALGAVFLGLQALVWGSLWRAGLLPSSGTFGSVFYAFTVFHALHVAVGVGGLTWAAFRARRGAGRSAARLWSWYWHFVGVLWVALYATVFLA